MPTVKFFGRVFPDAVKLDIAEHPRVNWKDQTIDLDLDIDVSISASRVEITCALPRFDHERHFVPVYMRAFDIARTTVDLAAFATGYGFTVLIEQFTDASGVTTPIVPMELRLSQYCTAFSLGPSADLASNHFNNVLQRVLKDHRIFPCLRDLIDSIILPHVSSTNCARAIEGLREMIANENIPRDKAWQRMQIALNASKDYIQSITNASRGPRHGDRTHIPGTVTTEIVERSWILMNRFLEYKKRGDTALPIDQFPMLS
ncbi:MULTISPECIES: hypothetical protein [unclassified Bradyrhizobium]|uniref:hypothetical protein n=1 Tax=unclassified Bradyrhizobium TaxID=2631580 RepID=UPI002916C6A9|nr:MULTISPECIES: hypothetical protein [unclassified Bradyrhizobium]